MRKAYILLASVCLLLLVIWLLAKRENAFESTFERSVTAARQDTNLTVSISSITDFQWDTLFIFGPYTSVDAIHAKLGYKWSEAAQTQIEWSDRFNLLVFTKDGKVVRYFKLPRGIGDFPDSTGGRVFPRGQDEFVVLPQGTNTSGAIRLGLFAKNKKPQQKDRQTP
jgi:hypothetical protein